MGHKIFPTKYAIESMKDSGYKDSAYAVAELIDNSIQAGEGIGRPIDVELICLEQDSFINERQSSKIEAIAVYDNASGMSADILGMALAFGQGTHRNAQKGMGKFGMGLPNASISQCNRVEVFTWQKDKIYFSYLDLDEIAKEGYDEVPTPKTRAYLPSEWKKRIKSPITDSGTLVIWKNLDRLKWKRHRAFFGNTEFIIGRMYRNFINSGECRIRMAAYADSKLIEDRFIRPNDPLYLMTGTNAPEPYNQEPPFEMYGDPEEIKIRYKQGMHKVVLRASLVKQGVRKHLEEASGQKAGSTELGKHCEKNLGISVVRAGRELELNHTYDIHYDPRERWWGIEVSFDPVLDELFGVTNNKQSATAFRKINIEDIAIEEGLGEGQTRQQLEAENDERFLLLVITEEINKKLSGMRKLIEAQNRGVTTAKKANSGPDLAERVATRATVKDHLTGTSDKKDGTLTPDQKKTELAQEIEKDGLDLPAETQEALIQKWLTNSKYIFDAAEIRSSRVIFDVSLPAGKIKVTINKSHPAYESLLSSLDKDETADSYLALKLILLAWARMEDIRGAESEQKRRLLEDIRIDWGNKANEMLEELKAAS